MRRMPYKTAAAEFKEAMSLWATGVTVVTTRQMGNVYGLTVSSFASASLAPPLIFASIGKMSPFLAMVRKSRVFAVSLLSRKQEGISRYFSQPGRRPAPRLSGIPIQRGITRCPLIKGALGNLECKLYKILALGDHYLLVGEVIRTRLLRRGAPLLYFRRRYRLLDTA